MALEVLCCICMLPIRLKDPSIALEFLQKGPHVHLKGRFEALARPLKGVSQAL